MQSKLERRHDPEISAPTAKGPEKILILLLARRQNLPVGGDHLGAEEVVARQADTPGEVADAASKGEPADSRRRDDSPGGRQAVGMRRVVEDAPCRAAFCPCGRALRVDLNIPHARQIDDDCVVRGPEPRNAVATSPYRE